MSLVDLCLQLIAKPEVIALHINDLEMLPVNMKASLFFILSKRGQLNDFKLYKNLVTSYLTQVDLSETVVNDEYLQCLVKCKNLQVLDLSLRRRQTRKVTSEVLIKLFSSLPRLKVIAIPHCREVNDKVMEAICRTCTSLVELHIPNSSITDYSLHLMGLSLHNLSVMNLLGTLVTDCGVESLLKGELRNRLREVNIDKCPNITLLTSQIIDRNCPNIKIFTCGGFYDPDESGAAMDRIRSKAQQSDENGENRGNCPWVYIFYFGDTTRSIFN